MNRFYETTLLIGLVFLTICVAEVAEAAEIRPLDIRHHDIEIRLWPETHELNLLFEMLVTVPRLERVPSLKEMAREAGLDAMPLGLLGYPVLQAADILLPRAHLVPVGKDNEAHVEVAREIARRFNRLYGDVFPVPDSLVGDIPLVGTDGHLRMEVRDWGIGFDPAKAGNDSFGLQVVRERANLLGGRTIIDSAPGRGARVVVVLPLKNNTPSET